MICMNCSWNINQFFLPKNIFYSFKAKNSEAFKSKIVVSFDFQNQKWKMEYEWYAWIQKLTIKEKRKVPSCLGWDLQNSWNCWDQKYLLIVLGRKNDWPPAYFFIYCRHQFAWWLLMHSFHQRTQTKERGGIIFLLCVTKASELLVSGN